jgi:hypothetical protein
VVGMIRGEPPDWAASGYGYGYGSGYGYGYGDGSGYGSGSGSGYGDGYGDGSGSGDGYGDGSYWLACLSTFIKRWSTRQVERLRELQAAGAKIAYWRSDEHGKACQGGQNKPVSPGTVETVKGPLDICTSHALHATLIPPKWNGNRLWVVALIGEVVGDEDKYGALQREIIGECLP